MRKADIAEAILSLAAPRERAGSILGDFLEDDPGALRFWYLVGRTAAAQAWRQLAAEPKALARLVIRSIIAEFGYVLAACIAYELLLYIAISVLYVSFHSDVPEWGKAMLQWSQVNLSVPFCVGRWMARRYDGRVASGAVALAILHTAINLCAGLVLWKMARTGGNPGLELILGLKLIYWRAAAYRAVLESAVLCATLYPVVVLVGAAFYRTRDSLVRG